MAWIGPGATAGAIDRDTGWMGPGATIPELLISDIPLLTFPPSTSHSFGRKTPAQIIKILFIIGIYVKCGFRKWWTLS